RLYWEVLVLYVRHWYDWSIRDVRQRCCRAGQDLHRFREIQLLILAPHRCSSHWEHLHDIGDCGVWRRSGRGMDGEFRTGGDPMFENMVAFKKDSE
ncbi:unnamed protein product, partial [Oppiella nova]